VLLKSFFDKIPTIIVFRCIAVVDMDKLEVWDKKLPKVELLKKFSFSQLLGG
jgi:hypothetical protein